jgi:hypothetical protein
MFGHRFGISNVSFFRSVLRMTVNFGAASADRRRTFLVE